MDNFFGASDNTESIKELLQIGVQKNATTTGISMQQPQMNQQSPMNFKQLQKAGGFSQG